MIKNLYNHSVSSRCPLKYVYCTYCTCIKRKEKAQYTIHHIQLGNNLIQIRRYRDIQMV